MTKWVRGRRLKPVHQPSYLTDFFLFRFRPPSEFLMTGFPLLELIRFA